MGNPQQIFQENNGALQEGVTEGKGSDFTCEICIEPMLSNKKFSNDGLCIHPFCLDCIAKYIGLKVKDNAVANLKCPNLNCDKLLDPVMCRPIIPAEVFDKWCDNLCDSAVSGILKCYCPYRNCSALVLNECGGTVRKVNCPNCKKNFCFKCKFPWHAGYWCSESRLLKDENDTKVGELIEKNKWTRCPACGHSVQRISGCSIITCRCGNLFCHKCGKNNHFGPCGEEGEWCRRLCPLFLLLLIILYYFLRIGSA